MEGTYSLEPYPKGKLRSFLLTVITLGRLSDIRERWDREKLLGVLWDSNLEPPAQRSNALTTWATSPTIIRPNDTNLPIARRTKLGWILFGRAPTKSHSIRSFHQTCIIDCQIKTFWELEEIPFQTKENP